MLSVAIISADAHLQKDGLLNSNRESVQKMIKINNWDLSLNIQTFIIKCLDIF